MWLSVLWLFSYFRQFFKSQVDAHTEKELKEIVQNLVDARLDLENIATRIQESAPALPHFIQTERGEGYGDDESSIRIAINSIDSAINDLEDLLSS